MAKSITKSTASNLDIEQTLDIAFSEYCLDAPALVNPIPKQTKGLRRICEIVHCVLPVAKLIIGCIYIKECPTNNWLPIYMIVGGALQLLFLIVLVYQPLREPLTLFLIGFLIVIWGIISSVNIFVEWKPDFFLGGWRYCHKGFFYFSFYVAVADYLIFSLMVIYVCTQFAYVKVPISNKESETKMSKGSLYEVDVDDYDVSDVSDFEFFQKNKLKERLEQMPLDERIKYLEKLRLLLQRRQKAEDLTQGIIIIVVLVMLTGIVYFTM